MSQVVSLLTIDARGAEAGSAQYVRSMKAAQSAVDRLRDAEERAAAARERGAGVMLAQNDGLSRTARAWERLRSSVDPAIAQQREIERAQLAADSAFRRGIATQAEAARVVDLVKQRYGAAASANDNFAASAANATRQTGLARHEMINLGRQVQDVATQLAMGQSPMQVLAAQGAQVADIFMSTQGTVTGFLRQVGGSALRFAGSGAGVATGVAAIGAGAALSAYSYAQAQKAVETALRGVGAASGVSVAGINRLALAEASAAKVSVASAREIASAFAATGKVDPTRLPGLIGFSREYAAFEGMDTGDAAKELAGAFADPTRGAEMLAGKLGGLSDASRRWIADQQAAGNMLGAQNALLRVFQQQVEGTTERAGLLARAWDAVKRSVSDADDALGRALNGPTDGERLASLQAQRDRLQASAGPNAIGVGNQLRMLERQIRPLEAIVELERQRAEIIARRSKADNASAYAGQLVESLDPYQKTLREILTQRNKLEEAIKLNPGTQNVAEWQQWSNILDQAAKTLISTSDRQRQSNDLNVRAIGARTLAERTAVEVARINLDVAGDAVKMKERELLIVGKIAELQAQANREASDALRSAKDQAELAALRPYQRRMREIEIDARNERERLGSSTTAGTAVSLPATTTVITGMDSAFAGSLRKMMEAIPGISMISGFRSTARQAQLWSEAVAKYGSEAEARKWVAPPGNSQHERGMAADLRFSSPAAREEAHRRASEFGLTFPLRNESWHVEPIGGRSRSAGASTNALIQSKEETLKSAAATEQYVAIIRTANDNIEEQERALQIQAKALTATAYETGHAQKAQELYNQLAQNGVPVTKELAAAVEQTAQRYGRLAEAAASVKLSQDVRFDREQLGRSASEQQIASRLRGTGIGMDSAIADQMRFNQALSDTKSLAGDAMSGFISDLRAGKSGMEALSGVLNRFADKLLSLATDQLISGLFKGVLGGGSGGGIFGSLFGGSSLFGGVSGGPSILSGTGGLYANGGVFGPAGVHAFALGGAFTNGIVNRPTLFPFANGTGLMGEAGPEAIMPLRRGPDGKLGVAAQGYAPMGGAAPAANSNAPAEKAGDTYNFSWNMPGADMNAIEAARRDFPALAVRAVQEAKRNRVPGL